MLQPQNTGAVKNICNTSNLPISDILIVYKNAISLFVAGY